MGCGAGAAGPRSGPVLSPPAGIRGCVDRKVPYARFKRAGVKLSRKRVSVHGSARDRGCAGLRAVLVSVAHVDGKRCRFVLPNGRLSRRRGCSRAVQLRARGTRSWKLQLKARLPRGRYGVKVRAVDRRGHRSRAYLVRVTVR